MTLLRDEMEQGQYGSTCTAVADAILLRLPCRAIASGRRSLQNECS